MPHCVVHGLHPAAAEPSVAAAAGEERQTLARGQGALRAGQGRGIADHAGLAARLGPHGRYVRHYSCGEVLIEHLRFTGPGFHHIDFMNFPIIPTCVNSTGRTSEK